VAQIERLRETGISVIFVSHRLEEVRRVANTVTVLRDGHRVWVGPAAGLDEAALVRRMVGRDVAYERRPPARPPETTPLLEVAGLSQGAAFRDVSLTLARGEIVGLAGLIGAGRTPLARAIAGIDPWDSGTVRLAGRDYRPRHRATRLRGASSTCRRIASATAWCWGCGCVRTSPSRCCTASPAPAE